MLDFMLKKYHGGAVFEQQTDILGNYCRLETPELVEATERHIGKFVREHQLISAAACTSFKASANVKEALSGVNAKLLDKSKLVRDGVTGEVRISELTPLMVACLMGNMTTARILVEHARGTYLPESPVDFRMFVDVKIARSMGGNNALLYACTAG